MAMFYNTIISWAVYYLFMSFSSLHTELPWKSCNHTWNTKCCVPADITAYPKKKSSLIDSANRILNTTTALPNYCSRMVYSTEEYFQYERKKQNESCLFWRQIFCFCSRRVQEIDKADAFNNLGRIKWELAVCLFVVFIFVYFALWKGIKSSGKVILMKELREHFLFDYLQAVWITAVAPYAVLLILLIRGVTLSGASLGIQYYLQPNLQSLKSFKVK